MIRILRRTALCVVVAAAVGSTPALAAAPVQTGDAAYAQARAALETRERVRPNTRTARNVILFVGDGMGVSTVTAARIFEGQSRGVDGESNLLAFETLPHVALAKTYSVDGQTSDSAATATALLSGVKTRNRVIGLGP